MGEKKSNHLVNINANKLANSKALKDIKEEYEKAPENVKNHFEEMFKICQVASGLNKVNKVLAVSKNQQNQLVILKVYLN